MKPLYIKTIIFFVLCFNSQLGYSQLFGGLILHPKKVVAATNITLSSISPYFVYSTYDTDYLPYVAPTTPATLVTPEVADGTADSAINIQGTITTTGVPISIPYTVTTSAVTLTAYTQTITIPATSTQDNTSRDLTFSYPGGATLAVGSGTITATLKAVGGDLNVKQLDVQTGIGNDNLGYLLGQFTYYVNGSSGTTANFDVRAKATMCGAFVAPGVYKSFMCHNLGADTSLDSNVAVQGIHGNYYQWGRSTVVANASTDWPAITSPAWNKTNAADYAWAAVTSGAKNIDNDPCPSGFKVPTKADWDGVFKKTVPINNTATYTGSWVSSNTNFGAAVHFGPDATTYTMTLTVNGTRGWSDGVLDSRGLMALYWSSTEVPTLATAWVGM